MYWINIKKEDLIGLECTNPYKDKYILRLSPNSKNIKQYSIIDEIENKTEDEIEAIYKNYTRILSIKVNSKPSNIDIQNILLSLQKEYDDSFEVNHFILNDKKVWLNYSTRLKLLNRLNIEKLNNIETTTIWFDDYSIEINVDEAITLINKIELYASKCFDNTQKHYAEIRQLETIQNCLNYDITEGYPDILNIQIQ